MHHADVVQTAVLDGIEHGDDAGRVDLDADDVEVRLVGRHFDGGLAVAEADVEHDLAVTTEDLGPVERRALHVETPSHDPLVELRLTLRGQRSPADLERRRRPTHGPSTVTTRHDHAVRR